MPPVPQPEVKTNSAESLSSPPPVPQPEVKTKPAESLSPPPPVPQPEVKKPESPRTSPPAARDQDTREFGAEDTQPIPRPSPKKRSQARPEEAEPESRLPSIPLPKFAKASVDKFKTASQATESAAGALGIPASVAAIAGVAVGALAAAAALKAMADVIKKLDAGILETVERLKTLSPDLARATATAELRRTMTDLELGQKYGGGMSQYYDARSRMSNEMVKIKTEVLAAFAQAAEPAVKVLVGVVDRVEDGVRVLSDGYRKVAEIYQQVTGLADFADRFMRRGERVDDLAVATNLFDLFLNTPDLEVGGVARQANGRLPGANLPPNEFHTAPQPGLGVP